jgi:hypothetical protein
LLVSRGLGWISLRDGRLFALAALTDRGRIRTMDVLLDPARLARIDLPRLEG